MQSEFTLAITGDTIINRRISVNTDKRFLSLIDIIRSADIGYTQFETLIHNYDGPEIYPAAIGPTSNMQSPEYVVDELKWAGFDMVSTASNHTMDYSYGGLYSTWKTMDKAGLFYAGTGMNLAAARAPVYMDTPKGRVALVSMCSSCSSFSAAGQTRKDVTGRPGLNPLRYYYKVNSKNLEMIKHVAKLLGYWIWNDDHSWLIHAPGVNRGVIRFIESEEQEITTVVDENDAEENLHSICEARRQADWVLVHHHSHEWDPAVGFSTPAKFVPKFARECIDCGADVFIGQGSQLLRGIEIYKNKPIFYDPGDFIKMQSTINRLPSEYYMYLGIRGASLNEKATPADAYDVRSTLTKPIFPPGGIYTGSIRGSIVAVCSYSLDRNLTGLSLYPVTNTEKPRSQSGIPLLAEGKTAIDIISYLAKVSSEFGTKIELKNDIGLLRIK